MTDEIEKLIDELKTRGAEQFAAWNESAFDAYCDGPLQRILNGLKWADKESVDRKTPGNYLKMVFEGVGAGWLTSQIQHDAAPSFLAHLLGSLVPFRIARVDQGARAEVLQMVWNIGEGLAHEPQWLNQYAIAETNWSVELTKLAQHMEEVLSPVLSDQTPSTWEKVSGVQVLDLRQHLDAFVPGRMYLAAPSVLCVQDRIGTDVLAILLQKKGATRVIGNVPTLPEYFESFDAPEIACLDQCVTINSVKAELPRIGTAREMFCAASGYVSITADDSQRLWLVDAA